MLSVLAMEISSQVKTEIKMAFWEEEMAGQEAMKRWRLDNKVDEWQWRGIMRPKAGTGTSWVYTLVNTEDPLDRFILTIQPEGYQACDFEQLKMGQIVQFAGVGRELDGHICLRSWKYYLNRLKLPDSKTPRPE